MTREEWGVREVRDDGVDHDSAVYTREAILERRRDGFVCAL